MGDFNVKKMSSKKELQNFTQHLLNDVQALEMMLEKGLFETDPIRIGAEQELCLIDKNWKPASINLEILEKAKNSCLTSELARFNLEINLIPKEFKGNCLSALEKEIDKNLNQLRKITSEFDASIVCTGILPSIRKSDVELDNITPFDRYYALMESIKNMRGEQYELRIDGIDELNIKLDSAIIEACNTGFQVHLQVTPDDFVDKYNVAQAIAAPVLAIAVNSPMLFGKRLWKESRIALFQQSTDTRSSSVHLRNISPRVMFGNNWVRGSILDIYREDITRFRVLLGANFEQNSIEMVEKGEIPQLKALTVHNSTVYRWNRPCYGISANGMPHLRIENRILPSGPSVPDEIANTAFWLGLMNGFGEVYSDVTKLIDFDSVRSNFFITANNGLQSNITWLKNKHISTEKLIKKELLPIARSGLEKAGVDKSESDFYLGIIEERNRKNTTGSNWILDSYSNLSDKATKEEIITAITASTVRNQEKGLPVHKWETTKLEDLEHWKPIDILVEEFMETDVFTVHRDDVIGLVLDMMDWRSIRYVPVEDNKGNLAGLVTSRRLLRYLKKNIRNDDAAQEHVEEIMIKDPIVVKPDDKITVAIDLMNSNQIGCLPVVIDNELIGIVTEAEFLRLSKRLFERMK